MKWVKSTFSAGNGACVEVAVDQGSVFVRDSKDPDGPRLEFTRSEWHAFVEGCRHQEFET